MLPIIYHWNSVSCCHYFQLTCISSDHDQDISWNHYFDTFLLVPDPQKAASQQERMAQNRRRLQEIHEAKAALYLEKKNLVGIPSYNKLLFMYDISTIDLSDILISGSLRRELSTPRKHAVLPCSHLDFE